MKRPLFLRFSQLSLLLLFSACKGSGGATSPSFHGMPELSDFGAKSYLINAIQELAPITQPNEVRELVQKIENRELCKQTFSEKQLYNPYLHLSYSQTSWNLDKAVDEVDYFIRPTSFKQIKVDYWSKTDERGQGKITRLEGTCLAPSAWSSRSVILELGVDPFMKKYQDCLRGGFPDPINMDDCQDGYEVIGGLVHRIKNAVLNKHRFRVSWWLKAPKDFNLESNKIRNHLNMPARIPLEMNSIHSELDENDAYRVKALAFGTEGEIEAPTFWLIADDQGRNREFLPLHPAELSSEILEDRQKLLELSRTKKVANFSGHFAWDRTLRMQRTSGDLPISRFFDDHMHLLFKKLRNGESLKVYMIYQGKDLDDVYLQELLLSADGELKFQKIKQLNVYGMQMMGLPKNTRNLNANGLEIYSD